MTIYTPTTERRQQLLEAACTLAEQGHYRNIRRHHLSRACDTSDGNVSRVLGCMEQMRSALIEYAVTKGRNAVVAQAIIDRHPAVDHLDQGARLAILAAVA
jgi:hypothetical protein